MCYKSPGPRCSGHAKAALMKAVANWKSATDDRSRTIAMGVMKEAQEEYYATPGGQKYLRKLIAETGDPDGMLGIHLEHGKMLREYRLAGMKDRGDVGMEDVVVEDDVELYRSVDMDGTVRYQNAQGQLHRVNGPALERADGSQEWYLNGELGRADSEQAVRVDQYGVGYDTAGDLVLSPFAATAVERGAKAGMSVLPTPGFSAPAESAARNAYVALQAYGLVKGIPASVGAHVPGVGQVGQIPATVSRPESKKRLVFSIAQRAALYPVSGLTNTDPKKAQQAANRIAESVVISLYEQSKLDI